MEYTPSYYKNIILDMSIVWKIINMHSVSEPGPVSASKRWEKKDPVQLVCTER
jgi:hypothetical protein